MLAIKNESYQSVTHNWRHDAHVFLTFAFLFFFDVVLDYKYSCTIQSSAYFRGRITLK